MTLTASTEKLRRDRVLIETLIDNPAELGPDFQPVVQAADRTLVAYKATGSGRSGSALADTLSLLSGAQATGLVERLDWAFRAHALDIAARARLSVALHITPEPETFGTACPPRLAMSIAKAKRSLRIGAEVHADGFADVRALAAAAAEWRSQGWQVIVCDIADDESALAAYEAGVVRADIVQLDLSLPGRAPGADGRPTDPAAARLHTAARDAGATFLAVGVHTPLARTAAERLGATLLRGQAVGAAGPLPG